MKYMSMPDMERFGRWLAALAQREQWAINMKYDPLSWDDWAAGHIGVVNFDVYVALQERGAKHVTVEEWQRITNAAAQGALGLDRDDVLGELARKPGLTPNGDLVFLLVDAGLQKTADHC